MVFHFIIQMTKSLSMWWFQSNDSLLDYQRLQLKEETDIFVELGTTLFFSNTQRSSPWCVLYGSTWLHQHTISVMDSMQLPMGSKTKDRQTLGFVQAIRKQDLLVLWIKLKGWQGSTCSGHPVTLEFAKDLNIGSRMKKHQVLRLPESWT